MNEKKLVFDVVFIQGSEDIFELRFKELYNLVDYFLIFGTKDNFRKIKKYHGVIDHKIKMFVLDDNFDLNIDDKSFISTSIVETLKELYKTFEDYVFFSYCNEIPDIKNLNQRDVESKEIKILNQNVYEINLSRKRKLPEAGTILVNFSHVLKNEKTFLDNIFHLKSKNSCDDVSLKNGYKILNYKRSPKSLPQFYFCEQSKKHIEYKYDKSIRKFIFLIDSDDKTEYADYIFDLKFKNNFPEMLDIDFRVKKQTLEIFIPKNLLYDGDFEIDYKINEVKRVLSIFDCQDNDLVEIRIGKLPKKTLKYNEIKNPSF